MEITGKTKVKELMKIPCLKEAAPYLIAGKGISGTMLRMATLEQLCQGNWDLDGMIHGMNRLIELAQKEQVCCGIYSEEECRKDRGKKEARIFRMPHTADRGKKPYVVVCAGGAYQNVCSIAEGFPIAAALNELGYDVFVLSYRVGGKKLMPKPLEDLAAALRYIDARAKQWQLAAGKYILTGFSAGGNLITEWCTAPHGCRSHGMPLPQAMFPVYPLISMKLTYKDRTAHTMSKVMFGKRLEEIQESAYNVDEHMDSSFPPCYIVCCADDDLVPPENSRHLKRKLDELGIAAELEVGGKGGHGFGEGTKTDVKGWIGRAVLFYETKVTK